MYAHLSFLLVIAFTCLSYVYSTQLCYDCDPRSENNCVAPELHSIKITNCEEDRESSSTNPSLEFECFTLYGNGGENKTGFYRGCTPRSTGVSTCDNLLEQYRDYSVTLCKTCSTDKCNTVFLPEPKDDEPGGDNSNGVAALSLKFDIIAIGVLFWICSYFST